MYFLAAAHSIVLVFSPTGFFIIFFFFFFNDTATTEIYTLPTRRSSDLRGDGLHRTHLQNEAAQQHQHPIAVRSEEHTSELQSRGHLVCRLLLEKKKKIHKIR